MVASRSDGALRVLLQIVRAQDAGDPYAFRFSPQDYILPTAGGESPSARFDWTEEMLADLSAVRQPGRAPAVVQRVGERLRNFIKDAGWEQHERDIAQAVAERRRVYVTIRSSAAEMYALPWELLTLKSGQHLGEVDGLLVRFEWPESEHVTEQPLPRPEGGRILVAWSAAAGAVPAAEHLQAISSACAAGLHSFDLDTDVIGDASLARIEEKLEQAQRDGPPIAVLHLLCHGAEAGGTFGVGLTGEEGPAVIDAAELRRALAPFSAMVRLVVLSACDSGNTGALGNQLGSLAQALHRCGYQAVVASRFPLSVAGSITLTQSLFGELLSGPASLESALLAARKQLSRSESWLQREKRTFDWASVQLYSRLAEGEDTRPIVIRPYRGLLAFQPKDSRFFVGRDKEKKEIVSEIQALLERKLARFFIVTGASGIGKSSLVLAGVVPALLTADPELVFLRMCPGADPVSSLRETLAPLRPAAKALLLVDQFEEIFTQTTSAAVREAFVQELWSLASAAEPGLRVILTLRVDFIGRYEELKLNQDGLRLDRVAYDEAHRCFVAQLEPAQLQSAILEPARKVGLALEAGLADRILVEVGNEPGALPLLQDVLDGLWQRREGRLLTQAAYGALGGIVGALQKRAEEITDALSQRGDLQVARRLLVSLVEISEHGALDTRLRMPIHELKAQAGELSSSFDRVLDVLVNAGLLVQAEEGQTATAEIAHEALIRKWPRLRTWLAEDRASLVVQRRVRQAAKEWEQSHDESLLYRGTQLAWAAEWRKNWNARMGDLERQFLDASEALRARTKQQEREAAEKILQLLLASYVDRGQRLLTEGKPEEALLWLHQAYLQGSQSKALPFLLRRALQPIDRRLAVLWARLAQLTDVIASPDGQRVLVRDQTGVVQILAVTSGKVLLSLEIPSATPAAFSPDGRRVLFCCGEVAKIHDVESGNLVLDIPGSLIDAAFSPDGSAVLGLTSRRSFLRCDATTGKALLEVFSDERLGEILAYSGDGSRLLASTAEGALQTIATEAMKPMARLAAVKGYDLLNAELDRSGQRVLVAMAAPEHPERAIVSIHDVTSGARISEISGVVRKEPRSARLSPTGACVLACREGSMAAIYDASSGRTVAELRGDSPEITAFAFALEGQRIITTGNDMSAGAEQSIRIYDATVGQPVQVRATPQESAGPSDSAADIGAPNDRYNFEPMLYNSIWVQDKKTSEFVAELVGHEDMVMSIRSSREGRWVVSTSADCTARVWNGSTFRAQAVLTGHTGPVRRAVFSQDSQRVLTSSEDGSARLFDVETGFLLALYSTPPAPITTAWFAPGDRFVITRSSDGKDRVWDAAPEARSAEALKALISKRALWRFESEASHIAVHNLWK